MYSRSRASKNHFSQKSVTFQNEISTEPLFYEAHLLPVKISEGCILSIQFYAGSKFCVISTICFTFSYIRNVNIICVDKILSNVKNVCIISL